MARYRKVEVKTWNDGKFRDLSPIPPCGQGLWLWFLTGTRTTNIPGVVIGTDQVMAGELRWSVEAFREAFREASAKGMAKGDWEAGLVWLPNASRPGENRNKPESPNVIRSWRDTWEEIPECALKLEIWQQLKAFAEAFGKGFAEAFAEACRRPWVKPSGHPSPNQEQEQEQEQEYTQRARARQPEPTSDGRERKANGNGGDPDHDAFERIKRTYPSFTGRQDWISAQHHCHLRIERDGATWDDLEQGVVRYAAYCAGGGVSGPKYVMTPARFFSEPDKPWSQPWALPAAADRPYTPSKSAAELEAEAIARGEDIWALRT